MSRIKLPRHATIGEIYGPAVSITEQPAADAYFEALVRRVMIFEGKSRIQAEDLERTNLGYYAGYFDVETRERVERLYGAQHPIFGSVQPSPREAILAGMVAATSGADLAASVFRDFGAAATDATHTVTDTVAALHVGDDRP